MIWAGNREGFNPETRDGIVLFINGPASTNVQTLVDGMRLLDPDSKIAMLYEMWIEAYEAQQETE